MPATGPSIRSRNAPRDPPPRTARGADGPTTGDGPRRAAPPWSRAGARRADRGRSAPRSGSVTKPARRVVAESSRPGRPARRPQRRHRQMDAVPGIRRCGDDHGVAVVVDLLEEPADHFVGCPENPVQPRLVDSAARPPGRGVHPGEVRGLEEDHRPAGNVPHVPEGSTTVLSSMLTPKGAAGSSRRRLRSTTPAGTRPRSSASASAASRWYVAGSSPASEVSALAITPRATPARARASPERADLSAPVTALGVLGQFRTGSGDRRRQGRCRPVLPRGGHRRRPCPPRW